MPYQFPPDFIAQPELSGDTIHLSPLRETDRAALSAAASDPGIWAGHPARERYRKEVFDPYFDFLLGLESALVIRLADSGEVIGCSVFYTDTTAPARLSIGFTFLVRKHWGGQTNRQVKALMLDHIFQVADEAWFHIAPTNIRSQVATQRLGAVFTHEAPVDLGTGAQPWRCYCLTREAWAQSQGA